MTTLNNRPGHSPLSPMEAHMPTEAVDPRDTLAQYICAASLDLHVALATLDGHRATERIQQAINGLAEAVTQLNQVADWPPDPHRG